ncbi:FtsX-like permease family protein [Leekyejoonella antrihumi]|uniref:FtsX-like permease family protein n=1 Tax=Leekyejoonella antrihumi TaxID=1660198 RepID=UPI001648EABD|nr:FtsX-like permease family protein [Leekyejoonella antrihumi]
MTGCAVFAPWYDRALQQSMVRTALSRAAVDVSGVRVMTQTPESRDAQPVTTSRLVGSVPQSIRQYFGSPVQSSSVQVGTHPVTAGSRIGQLVWRSGMCRQLLFTAGRCPASKNDIAISAQDAKLFGWQVGSTIPVAEVFSSVKPAVAPHRTLRVVGIYRPDSMRSAYWFGSGPTGYAGTSHPLPGQDSGGGATSHDWWFSPATTFAGKRAWTGHAGPGTSWMGVVNEIDLPMAAGRVGVDQLLSLAPRVQAYANKPPTISYTIGWTPTITPGAIVSTGIGDLAARARHGREQANALVPLFMVQLALLAALTLWLVLGAAMESRRPEVALARLRGFSRRRARRMLLAEVGPVVGLGGVAGVAGAALLTWAAEHTWLAAGTPFEVRWPVWATAGAVVVGLTGMAWVRARSTARADPAQLLRRVPPRRAGWAIGAGDLLVIVLAGAAFVAAAIGSLTGIAGMAAPTLLALTAGLLLAHLLGPGTARLGRWMLRRGGISGGLALLQTGRRPSTRKVIATITVATALLVFAGDAVLVGARNRGARAEAETGAAAVSTINSPDVGSVQAAVHQADPTGRAATTIAMVSSPGQQGTTTVAVDPAAFARIGQFPGLDVAGIPWDKLAPKDRAIQVTGTTMTVRATSAKLTTTGRSTSLVPVQLRAIIVDSHSQQQEIALGALPVAGSAPHTLSAPIGCANGCLLTGFDFYAPGGVTAPLTGRVTLRAMSVSGHPLTLGEAGAWRNTTAATNGSTTVSDAAGGGLVIGFRQSGTSDVTLGSTSVPSTFPALVAGPLPAGSQGNHFQAPGLDGLLQRMTRVGSLPFVPGAPPDSSLVNIASLQRLGALPASTIQVQVWYARDNPTLIGKVTAALEREGIAAPSTTTTGAALHRYDQTATTWALQLGVVVGAVAAIIAALTLLIAVTTTWRLRSRDYAALRMTGLSSRRLRLISIGEQLPVVVLSVLLGVACGVVGAQVAMPKIPLFDTPPDIPIINYGAAWAAVAAAGIGALIVLGAVGWVSGRWVARRARLTRLREAV